MTSTSPETLLLTRIFQAQRRLRFVRGVAAALRWFVAGSALASLGLVALWNWDRLPGPWQWLASAGRPRELLWLPLLLALGGFSSRWLDLPGPREAAYRLDQVFDTRERLLTAVDWILTEKPRTRISERVLRLAAETVDDEVRLRREVLKLERVPRKSFLKALATLLLPIGLLTALPDHVGLPTSAAVWMSPHQVDNLTKDLMRELETARSPEDPEQKLKELQKKLEQARREQQPHGEQTRLERELQQALDQLARRAAAQESARQLLETLSQRARQGRPLSEQDREALRELKSMAEDQAQADAVEQVQRDWEAQRTEEAAEGLESLQQQAGQKARQLEDTARQGQAETMPSEQGGQGQEYDEGQGEQYPGEGQGQGQGEEQKGEGQGSSAGNQQGEGRGDAGIGTTEQEGPEGQGVQGNRSLRQSERTSDWSEEFRHLHPPERTDFEKSQTRVRGQKSGRGPRFATNKEGRGEAQYQPGAWDGADGMLEYRESAENALLREEIPADYRENVRLYFETLDGGGR